MAEKTKLPPDQDSEYFENWRAAIKNDTFGNYHLEMGVAILHQEDNIEVALEHFQNSLNWRSWSAEAWYFFVNTLQRMNRIDDATVADRQAIAVNPDYYALGLCAHALRLIAKGEVAEAERRLGLAADRAPGHPATRAVAVLVRLHRGEAEPPLVLPTGSGVREPADFWSALVDEFLQLGQAHLTAGKLGTAEACYRAAVACGPDDEMALAGLAKLLVSTGRYGEAGPLLRTCRATAPHVFSYAFDLGLTILRGNGSLDEAEAALHAAAALAPDHYPTMVSLRRCLLYRGQFEAALAAITAALGAHPQDGLLLKEEALFHHMLGDLAGAAARWRKIREMVPGETGLRTYEALVELARGRSAEAQQHLAAVLETAPKDARATSTLGLLHLTRGETAEAVRLCGQGLEWARGLQAGDTGPHLVWNLIALAVATEGAGDPDQADQLLRQAIAGAADQVWVICRLHAPFSGQLEAAYGRIGFTRSGLWPPHAPTPP